MITSYHFNNLISPNPAWNSQWSLIPSRNLKRQHHCQYSSPIFQVFLKKVFSENPVNLEIESCCKSNLTILCVYLNKGFANLWQLHQECLTQVTGRQRSYEIIKAVNQLQSQPIFFPWIEVSLKGLFMVPKFFLNSCF